MPGFRADGDVIRLLRVAERAATPWKNGGGVTREIMVWPQGAGLDDFTWRVSIAEVREAGPFSRFDNIDRAMMVLRGRMKLTFADSAVELAPDDEPFAFAGEAPCTGTPLDGPVTDLNVMTRRGLASASVRRIAGDETVRGDRVMIVALGRATLAAGAERVELGSLDAALVERGGAISIRGAAYAISFA